MPDWNEQVSVRERLLYKSEFIMKLPLFVYNFYRLLDILEVIAPYKHFHKLRNFMNTKLPPGFPVKIG